MEFQLFQTLKDDAMKVLHSICQQIWKTQQWKQDWKRSVFIPIPKKGNAKECPNYHTVALISYVSKVMLKILQARLQRMWTVNFQIFKLDLEKAEEPAIKLPTFIRSSKKQDSSRKNIYFCFTDYAKPLTVWITTNCGKLLKRWKYQTNLPASCETCMQVKKKQNQSWNNGLVQNWERSTSRMYLVTLLVSLLCRVHHVKCWAGESQAGIKISGRNIKNLRYADDTTLMAESEEPLDEGERGEWISWLKTQHSKN